MPALLAKEGPLVGRRLQVDASLTLGRGEADVVVDDPEISRRHALIVRHPQGVRLLDDRSLNGVFVNEARVDSRILQDGDEIIIGRYRLTLVSLAPHGGEKVRTADSGSLHEHD